MENISLATYEGKSRAELDAILVDLEDERVLRKNALQTKHGRRYRLKNDEEYNTIELKISYARTARRVFKVDEEKEQAVIKRARNANIVKAALGKPSKLTLDDNLAIIDNIGSTIAEQVETLDNDFSECFDNYEELSRNYGELQDDYKDKETRLIYYKNRSKQLEDELEATTNKLYQAQNDITERDEEIAALRTLLDRYKSVVEGNVDLLKHVTGNGVEVVEEVVKVEEGKPLSFKDMTFDELLNANFDSETKLEIMKDVLISNGVIKTRYDQELSEEEIEFGYVYKMFTVANEERKSNGLPCMNRKDIVEMIAHERLRNCVEYVLNNECKDKSNTNAMRDMLKGRRFIKSINTL